MAHPTAAAAGTRPPDRGPRPEHRHLRHRGHRRDRLEQPGPARRRRPHARRRLRHRPRAPGDLVRQRSRPASRTFGYLRLEIFAAVANAVLLFGVAAFMLFEAWQRLSTRPASRSRRSCSPSRSSASRPTRSRCSCCATRSETSLTVRGAYLEVLGDLAGSSPSSWRRSSSPRPARAGRCDRLRVHRPAHPAAHLSLLRDAIDVLLEATPKGVDMDHVRSHILEAPGRVDVPRPARLDHHLGRQRRLGPRRSLDRRRSASGARPPAHVPLGRVRHRALDVPARDADRRRLEEPSHA